MGQQGGTAVFELNGKRVVVTGASKGIGKEAAIALARAGANVAGTYFTDPAGGAETKAAIEALGCQCLMLQGDVSESSTHEALADAVVEAWGGVDVWINNAARLLVTPLLNMSDQLWGEIMASNLNSYFYGCRAAARRMTAQGGGKIINITSVVDVQPIANMCAYTTAKGGVVALTKQLALELGPQGITVTAMAPGATDTPLNIEAYTPEVRKAYCERIALGRIASPEEIADIIVFLASDGSRYITGHELLADGGLVINGTMGHKLGATSDPLRREA
jgi:NAD(P)-dependent dehydrogenase (short-subunit alcohol dehydrogenase family)